MIAYDNTDSPFFLMNKKQCEEFLSVFSSHQLSIAGHCSSYGFALKAQGIYLGYQIDLAYNKTQPTTSVYVYKNHTPEYITTEVTILGLNTDCSIKLEKSLIRRFFMSSSIKKVIRSPYYLKLCKYKKSDIQLEEIRHLTNTYKTVKLTLVDGKISVMVVDENAQPVTVLNEVLSLIKKMKM